MSRAGESDVERLRAVLQEVVRTAAECRRHLTPDGAKVMGYFAYRKAWDESMAAEVMAEKVLKETLDAE